MTKIDKTGLTSRQKKALPLLVTATTEKGACNQAKISRQTYYDWLKNPVFRDELSRLRNQIVIDAIETLKTSACDAVNTLMMLLNNKNPSIQRNVANDILEHILKFKSQQEIEKRVEILESLNISTLRSSI